MTYPKLKFVNGMVTFSALLHPDLYRKLMKLSLMSGDSIQEVLRMAVEAYHPEKKLTIVRDQ